ncbi:MULTISPECIES: NUDIX hydrolase [unclassified Clostridium]|uniref:NUDIX hydrolase n=1 Tax=unclassified Clostridium TaxID=2614128 RepID=UPI0025BD903D|nr:MULTISPECIES: CoA pyrophosphatase [unclassified Clostridium]
MIDNIKDIFKDREIKPIGKYKNSAVMILLCEDEESNDLNIIFEVRSNKLKTQPGDICLPGGMIEEGENPKETAIRETMEELNLNKEDIEYIGDMDYFISPYGMFIYPFISKTNLEKIIPSKEEVDHIFTVPLKFFIESTPLLYELEIGAINKEGFPFHLINGGEEYKFRHGKLNEYFYEYDNYVIWGFTAQIIKTFIDIIKNNGNNML